MMNLRNQAPLLSPSLPRGLGLGLLLGLVGVSTTAQARPSGPELFCEAYPESPDCMGRFTTCSVCHTSTDPAQWNAYGAALLGELAGQDFDTDLWAAMARLEDLDADGDGETNLDEILVGTNPGNAESLWRPVPEVDGDNPWYALGSYDVTVAYRRAMVLYCGHSADYEELKSLQALEPEAQRERLHEAVAMCLDAEYWRTTGLRELADPRVRPIYAIGADTDVNFDGERLVLADYHWDYRLWRYIMTDDRDLRELLTAQYHVDDDGAGGLVPVEGPIPPIDGFAVGGQPLSAETRAGMITTQWFLMSNTMFSGIPRTTAAQAYRSFLGMDISKNEGLVPVEGEPVDVDLKGVAEPVCAQCHSTLDPLSYAFSYYHGIADEYTGVYDPNRPTYFVPDWDPTRPSAIFGQPVDSVVQWGQVASESIYFRRAMAQMFFAHALGGEPGPGEYDELEAIIASIPDDGYSANRMIHRIVDTDAFGAP